MSIPTKEESYWNMDRIPPSSEWQDKIWFIQTDSHFLLSYRTGTEKAPFRLFHHPYSLIAFLSGPLWLLLFSRHLFFIFILLNLDFVELIPFGWEEIQVGWEQIQVAWEQIQVGWEQILHWIASIPSKNCPLSPPFQIYILRILHFTFY